MKVYERVLTSATDGLYSLSYPRLRQRLFKDLAELLPHNPNQRNSQKRYIDSECFQRF